MLKMQTRQTGKWRATAEQLEYSLVVLAMLCATMNLQPLVGQHIYSSTFGVWMTSSGPKHQNIDTSRLNRYVKCMIQIDTIQYFWLLTTNLSRAESWTWPQRRGSELQTRQGSKNCGGHRPMTLQNSDYWRIKIRMHQKIKIYLLNWM